MDDEEDMGKCIVCKKETHRVIFSRAIVKTYICSMDCLKKYFRTDKGFKVRIQKKLKESEGWLD